MLIKREPRNRLRRTHRVSGGIVQLFLNFGTRRGFVVSITPRPSLPQERPGTHCTGGWVGPEPVWIGAENLAPPGFDPLTFQPVASLYTDYAIPEPVMLIQRLNRYLLITSTLYKVIRSLSLNCDNI
jgi:hypothetical protein